MGTRSSVLAVGCLLVVACGGASAGASPPGSGAVAGPDAAAPRYAVKLDRAQRAGQRWRVRARSRHEVSTSLGEDAPPPLAELGFDEVRSADLTAVVTVLEVSAEGREVRTEYVVERLRVDLGEGTYEPLTPGARIVVTRGDPPTITVDGTTAPDRLVETLELVLETGEDLDDDAVFGTDVLQPVGGSWPIDQDAARADFIDLTPGSPVGALEGTMQLVERISVAGRPALRVRGYLRARDLRLEELPAAEVTHAAVYLQVEGVYPVDPSLHEVSARYKLSSSLTVRPEGELGLLGQLELRLSEEVTQTFEALPDRAGAPAP